MKFGQFLLLASTLIAISCNKSSSDDTIPTVNKPRLGTTWTYQKDTYGVGSPTFFTTTEVHKVTSQVTLGGESWFKVTDDTLGTVFLINEKTGGLYQYDGSSQLLCKDPCAVNDTYNTSNAGEPETFTVKQVGLTLGVASGSSFSDIKMYEGYKSAVLRDQIWYSNQVWIAKREAWLPGVLPGSLRRHRWILQTIQY